MTRTMARTDQADDPNRVLPHRRMRSPEEYEWMGDAMLVARAGDGTEGQVWHSELHALDCPWPNAFDKNGNRVSQGVE